MLGGPLKLRDGQARLQQWASRKFLTAVLHSVILRQVGLREFRTTLSLNRLKLLIAGDGRGDAGTEPETHSGRDIQRSLVAQHWRWSLLQTRATHHGPSGS